MWKKIKHGIWVFLVILFWFIVIVGYNGHWIMEVLNKGK